MYHSMNGKEKTALNQFELKKKKIVEILLISTHKQMNWRMRVKEKGEKSNELQPVWFQFAPDWHQFDMDRQKAKVVVIF